jgi:hypothetical protein
MNSVGDFDRRARAFAREPGRLCVKDQVGRGPNGLTDWAL